MNSSREFDVNTTYMTSRHVTLFDIHYNLAVGYVCLVLVFILIGTVGNMALVAVVRRDKRIHDEARMFIINNAIADLCVTAIADPMCIAGAFTGRGLLTASRWLCVTVASMCLTACVCSFLCVTSLTVNRYVYICHQKLYYRVFNKPSVLLMCVGCWLIAFSTEVPNFFGWGGHFFDPKSHQCIWDRTADRSYTLFVALVLIGSPLLLMGYCNSAVVVKIWTVKKTIVNMMADDRTGMKQAASSSKILISLFTVFLVCWTPYCFMLVTETGNTYTMSTHLFITLLAHMHSSASPTVYFLSKKGYRQQIRKFFCCANAVEPTPDMTSSKTTSKRQVAIYHSNLAKRRELVPREPSIFNVATDVNVNRQMDSPQGASKYATFVNSEDKK